MAGGAMKWWFIHVALALTLIGCGPAHDAKQIERWRVYGDLNQLANTVKNHELSDELRSKAAVAFLEVDPIRGRHRGTDALLVTLGSLDATQRSRIVGSVVDAIVAKISKGDAFAHKDAGYLLLIDDQATGWPLLPAGPHATKLRDALTQWAVADFKKRSEPQSQRYGMEPLFELLGSAAVAQLPPLIERGGRKVVDIIVRHADGPTRAKASEAVVDLIKRTAMDKWRQQRADLVRAANKKAGFSPGASQLNRQLRDYQREALGKAFGSAREIGGAVVTTYLLQLASDGLQSARRRQMALAALEGHVAANDTAIAKLLALLDDRSPPMVLDQLLLLIKRLPRDKVASALYRLFDTDDWKVRQAAATTLLEMSRIEHIDAFMQELGRRAKANFTIAEALSYGTYLGQMKGDVRRALEKHRESGSAHARMSALAIDYRHGTKKHMSALKLLTSDSQQLPSCDDCGRTCIERVSTTQPSIETDIKTIGNFVRHCVLPQMWRDRAPGGHAVLPLYRRPRRIGERALPGSAYEEHTRPKKRRRGTATPGGLRTVSGKIANSASVVARMKGRFRACFNAGLRADKTMAGSVTLTAKVGANGQVLSVDASAGASLRPIVSCLQAVVRSGGFAPPEGGSAVISIPITFTRQQ